MNNQTKKAIKIHVTVPEYISDTCYFLGNKLVHEDGCYCDEDYEYHKEMGA
jgi:hypothetical protein